MASLEPEEILFTIPDGSSVGSRLDVIDVDQIIVDDITVTGTFNGQAVAGAIVFTNSVQTLTNKTLVGGTSGNDVTANNLPGGVIISAVPAPIAGDVLTATSATTAEWAPSSGGGGTTTVPNGGTGVTTLTAGNFLIGNGVSPVTTTKVAPAGVVVGTTDAQTLTNKTLDDTTTRFVDTVDPTIQVAINAAGSTATTATLTFTQTANRVYTVPDSGANASFVMTEGNQTINGTKTFTSITITATTTDTINEATAGHGVYVDNVRIAEDTIVTPAMTLASMRPIGAATNITVGVIPKGTGAIIAATPDNAATGGNIRGINAVDWQVTRTTAAQVASGDYSTIIGGNSNSAAGAYSIAGGRRAQVPNAGSLVFADSTNADFSSTLADQFNTRYAGGYRLTGGVFSLNDRSFIYTSGTGSTVGAVTTDIYTLATASNTLYYYTARIIAATSAGNTVVLQQSIKAKNVAGTVTIGSSFDGWTDNDAAVAAASFAFVVSGTNIIVRGTGVAAQTINWRGEVNEVSMAF